MNYSVASEVSDLLSATEMYRLCFMSIDKKTVRGFLIDVHVCIYHRDGVNESFSFTIF